METTEQKQVMIPAPTVELAKKLNNCIFQVIGSESLDRFERAYTIAYATVELKKLLTTEYMKPIMALQGNRLGFKTDKDSAGGYPEEVVKNCLIEATLTGVQPSGNQFNIIAGNCYITKEGFGFLLKKITGLVYDITFELPRINADKSGAAISAIINWSYLGQQKDKKIELPIRMNQAMGTDAVIGKATRKARKWLFETITGVELGDGDVTEDAEAKVISSRPNPTAADKEAERMQLLLDDCKTVAEIEQLQQQAPDYPVEKFNQRKEELKGGKNGR